MKIVLGLAAAVVAAGSLQLGRAGYSVDEEFTVFAIRGIRDHGLPLLPSGLLYDRGIAYSYAAFLTGSELVGPRLVSLLSAALSVWLTFTLIARVTNERAAVVASALVAVTIPFWATATSARFYAPFLALYLASLLSMRSSLALAAAIACLCRLTHELAFTLAAVPAVCWIVQREHRAAWLRTAVAVVTGLVAGQAILFALHAMAPSSGDTMVRRFFLWQVLNLFEVPGDRQFMIPVVVMVMAWLIAPARAWLFSVTGLSLAAMIAAYSIARATNGAPLSVELVRSVLAEGARYPMDMFWHVAATTPLTLLMAAGCLVARVAGAGGEWRPLQRGVHGLWIGWVLWFGVIESGITTNYLLLPTAFMMMAIAVDLNAVLVEPGAPARRLFSDPSRPAWAAVAGLVVLLAFDQWRGYGSIGIALDTARPTIHVEGIEELRGSLQPNDRVVCTDELGCLMLVGRIDRWLALDDYVRERFLVRKGDGPLTGVYTGAPAVFRPGDLFAANADGSRPDRVVVVDIFKDYPIGNSRSWLPKAIEEDGLQVVPLLETRQMRVVQVSPPEAVARLNPATYRTGPVTSPPK